jgi:hypothetical protein
MPETRTFAFGDTVIHADKPEWGTGVVTAASKMMHEGKPAQRLTLRFERAGLKHVNTALANIRPADEADIPAQGAASPHDADFTHEDGPPAAGAAPGEGSWFDEAASGDIPERMARLPEATRDPFATLEQRLRSTLKLYRFSDEGGSLLDWAAMQTGLCDPLTRFSRHELEQYFQRFATERAKRFKSLLLEAKRKDPALARRMEQEGVKQLRPRDKDLLRRINVPR